MRRPLIVEAFFYKLNCQVAEIKSGGLKLFLWFAFWNSQTNIN